MHHLCRCEERSDEAIQEFKDFDILGLLRFARNDEDGAYLFNVFA